MKKRSWVLAITLVIGLFALSSQGQAALVPACQVENPPANCETMWAIIAHVRVPKQPVPVVNQYPRCGSRFMKIDWGRTVADAFLAEADRETLENLALDVSDALQKKRLPQNRAAHPGRCCRPYRGEFLQGHAKGLVALGSWL